MRWNDEVMHGAAFVDWQPFQHPQLGPVDIGGWHGKLYQQNAPLQGPQGATVDLTVRSQRAGVVRRSIVLASCSSEI